VLELLLPPVLTAVLAVLVALVHAWRERRDARRRARDDLAWATAQLEFIGRWLTVRERVDAVQPVPAELDEDMASAFARARAGMASPGITDTRRLSVLSALRRVFLLRRMPRGTGVLHTSFYVALAWALLWNAAGAAILSEQGLDGGPAGTTPLATLIGYVATMLPGVLPAVILWLLTVRSERRHRQSPTSPPAPGR
jgi:hypothetical protein